MSADFISVGWVILGNMSPQWSASTNPPPWRLGHLVRDSCTTFLKIRER